MKRLLVFVVLLALGFAALRLAIGDEQVMSRAASGASPSDPARPRQPHTPAVSIDQGKRSAGLSFDGPQQIPHRKRVVLPDGSARHETVFVLRFEDSRALASGVQQLDDVEVQLFDRAAHAATLRASRAFVTLQLDGNGRADVDASKDIDLREVVLVSLPGSRLEGLRLELATATVRMGDDEVRLTTPPDQDVLVVLEGERRVTLRGKGAQALLPSGGSALRRADVEILREPVLVTDDVQVRARGRLRYVEDLDGRTGQITLEDHVELDLARARVALPGFAQRSRARANAGSGADAAARSGAGAGAGAGAGTGADGTTRVRGDQFVGWLLRTPRAADRPRAGDRSARDGSLAWRQLLLVGAPAIVEVPGAQLRTPKLTIVPGPTGEPALVSAHGGESTLEQTEPRPGDPPGTLTSASTRRRLVLWRPAADVGAVHRSLGFPRWTLRPIEQMNLLVVEGETRFTSGARSVVAANGARISARADTQQTIVRGLGRTHIEQRARTPDERDLIASGSDGFVSTTTEGRELLQLGPPMPDDLDAPGAWRDHTFDVRYGDATVRGRGVAEIEQRGERRPAGDRGAATGGKAAHDARGGDEDLRVLFASPDGTLDASLPEHGLRLQRVRRLQARLRANEPDVLEVAGWPASVTVARGADRLQAEAPRLLQIGPRSLRLLPPDDAMPELWSGLPAAQRLPVLRQLGSARGGEPAQQVEVRGPVIDVHHAGGEAAVVDATANGDDRPHLYTRVVPKDGGEATTIACTADRLRVLPFVLTPDVRAWHLGRRGGALAAVAFHSVGEAWLEFHGVREFELDDARHGHVAGNATRLTVGRGTRSAMFVGDADTTTPAEVVHVQDGRTTTLRGARVRVSEHGDGVGAGGMRLEAFGTFLDRSTFVPPSLTLHGRERSGLFSHMQASCRGTIEVLPESVEFRGPVVATSLLPDGAIDARGLQVDARALRLRREPSGQVVQIAGDGVVADWQQLHAESAHMEVDRRTSKLVAYGPPDVLVRMAGGGTWRTPRLEIDYENWSIGFARFRAAQPQGEVK